MKKNIEELITELKKEREKYQKQSRYYLRIPKLTKYYNSRGRFNSLSFCIKKLEKILNLEQADVIKCEGYRAKATVCDPMQYVCKCQNPLNYTRLTCPLCS